MRLRSLLVIVATTALAVAYYVVFERDAPPASPEGTHRVRVFASLDPAAVTRITLSDRGAPEAGPLAPAKGSDHGSRIELARAPGNAWRLAAPVDAPAVGAVADGLVRALAEIEQLAARPEYDPVLCGLDPPVRTIELQVREGTTLGLELGGRTAAGGRRFVRRLGESQALEVDEAALGPALVSVDTLRDRRLLRARPAEITRVRLAGPGGELRFRRDGPFWRFVPESEGFADRERVQTLLEAVTALAATRFVDDRPADLSRYGLKPPHAAITCSDAGGERTVLLGGRADRPGELYARRADVASVVAVEDRVSGLISWKQDEWRSRRVLHVRPSGVRAIEVTPPGQQTAARLERDGRGWWFSQPRRTEAARDAVERLLGALLAAGVVRQERSPTDARNFGLDRPLRLAIETRQQRVEVEIGAPSGRGDGRFVRVKGEGSVLDVQTPFYPTLLELYPALRARRLLHWPVGEISRITMRRGQEAARPYVRRPDGTYSTPGARAVVQPSFGELVARVAGLEALSVHAAPQDLRVAGLEKPWLVLQIERASAGGERTTARLDLGRRDPNGPGYHARFVQGDDVVYCIVAAQLVSSCEKDHLVSAPRPTARSATSTEATVPPATRPGSATSTKGAGGR